MSSIGQRIPEWLIVSRETESNLLELCRLVKKWTAVVNLVGKSTVEHLWERHILDSAQVFSFLPGHARTWIDLGSGAGFPGLVVAILAKEQRPNLNVTLIEADQRKAVFLSEAARLLDLSVTVLCARAESVAPSNGDVVSARALSSLSVLCGFAKRHVADGGVVVLPKGANVDAEIAAAKTQWKFSFQKFNSKTEVSASILVLKNIQDA